MSPSRQDHAQLVAAASDGRHEDVKAVLNAFSWSASWLNQPIFHAAQRNHWKTLDVLLEYAHTHGLSVNNARVTLAAAVDFEAVECVQLLLNTTLPHIKDLSCACRLRNETLTCMLLAHFSPLTVRAELTRHNNGEDMEGLDFFDAMVAQVQKHTLLGAIEPQSPFAQRRKI